MTEIFGNFLILHRFLIPLSENYTRDKFQSLSEEHTYYKTENTPSLTTGHKYNKLLNIRRIQHKKKYILVYI